MPSSARKHQLNQSLLYHIFNRGNAREEIFHAPEDYRQFIKILTHYSQEENNFRIYHWVLMPKHYHLLLEIDQPEKLSSIMAGVGRSYVFYHHKTYNSAGHLWQSRFKSQAIQKELYLLACGRYIERNPVKAGIVGCAEAYLYSSSAYYVFGKEDGLTKENPLFETFGAQIQQRRRKYQEFLMSFEQNEEDERLFGNLEWPRGTKEFLRRLVKERGLFLPRRRGKARNYEIKVSKPEQKE
jgi:putative transposase